MTRRPPIPVATVAEAPVEEPSPEYPPDFDLSDWSDEELIAQMLIVMVPSDDIPGFYLLAQRGVGAIVLAGVTPTPRLVQELANAQDEAQRGIRMIVTSDEEGGDVAHLGALLGRLPAPEEIAKLPPEEIRQVTRAQGEVLRKAGVHAVLAPNLDLKVEGTYMAKNRRAFSADPQVVADVGTVWMEGMHEAGVAVVVKHWPGIGSARDTHEAVTVLGDLKTLEQADLIPFNQVITAGADMVMLGHVIVPGLSENNSPVSLSPKAIDYIRQRSHPDLIIMTDSIDMTAATETLGLTHGQAAARSVAAGADMVMMGAVDSVKIHAYLVKQLRSGDLSREHIEDSVARVLRFKYAHGLLDADLAVKE